jgi:hypothetical protein
LNCLWDLKNSEQTRDLFNNIETDKLFLNIVEIFNCNLNFWQMYLYPNVASLNKTPNSTLINPSSFKTAFSQVNKNFSSFLNINFNNNLLIFIFQFKTVFAPYDTFCIRQNDSSEYLKQKTGENEMFRTFILVYFLVDVIILKTIYF